MSTWLYQLNETKWSRQIFRGDIWENRQWHWEVGAIREALGQRPQSGDVIIFFYAETRCEEPGIYGWAVVDRFDDYSEKEKKRLYFVPAAPTNHLKLDPWWDDDAKTITKEIRGEVPLATLFLVGQEHVQQIRRGIKRWLHHDTNSRERNEHGVD